MSMTQAYVVFVFCMAAYMITISMAKFVDGEKSLGYFVAGVGAVIGGCIAALTSL